MFCRVRKGLDVFVVRVISSCLNMSCNEGSGRATVALRERKVWRLFCFTCFIHSLRLVRSFCFLLLLKVCLLRLIEWFPGVILVLILDQILEIVFEDCLNSVCAALRKLLFSRPLLELYNKKFVISCVLAVDKSFLFITKHKSVPR